VDGDRVGRRRLCGAVEQHQLALAAIERRLDALVQTGPQSADI
jgi:hypothetical protein